MIGKIATIDEFWEGSPINRGVMEIDILKLSEEERKKLFGFLYSGALLEITFSVVERNP